jgi:hypothetical protein
MTPGFAGTKSEWEPSFPEEETMLHQIPKDKNLSFDLPFRVSLLIVAAVLGIAAASVAEQPSHLGQDIGDHVTLNLFVNSDNNCYPPAERVFADGSTEEFTIPSGKSLVVTDVQWTAEQSPVVGSPTLEVGRNLILYLFFGGESAAIVFRSPLLVTGENVTAPAKSDHLTAGFVMSAIPCRAFVQRESLFDLHPAFGSVFLYGYLIQTLHRAPAIR